MGEDITIARLRAAAEGFQQQAEDRLRAAGMSEEAIAAFRAIGELHREALADWRRREEEFVARVRAKQDQFAPALAEAFAMLDGFDVSEVGS